MPGNKGIDITAHFVRERRMSPKKCIRGSFRSKQMNDNVSIILCRTRDSPNKMTLQAILKRRNKHGVKWK